jgi:hypothetical protein
MMSRVTSHVPRFTQSHAGQSSRGPRTIQIPHHEIVLHVASIIEGGFAVLFGVYMDVGVYSRGTNALSKRQARKIHEDLNT